jgi:hypothetical protein
VIDVGREVIIESWGVCVCVLGCVCVCIHLRELVIDVGREVMSNLKLYVYLSGRKCLALNCSYYPGKFLT